MSHKEAIGILTMNRMLSCLADLERTRAMARRDRTKINRLNIMKGVG